MDDRVFKLLNMNSFGVMSKRNALVDTLSQYNFTSSKRRKGTENKSLSDFWNTCRGREGRMMKMEVMKRKDRNCVSRCVKGGVFIHSMILLSSLVTVKK